LLLDLVFANFNRILAALLLCGAYSALVIQNAPTISRRGFVSLSLLFLYPFQLSPDRIEFLSFDRLEPLLPGNRFTLPGDLSGTRDQIRAAWPRWIQSHDREIRARLVRGEEDTLVNFILFGVSFTDRPRVLPDDASETALRLIDERTQHFIAAIAMPNSDRLNLLNNLLSRLGYRTSTEPERQRLRQYISSQVSRYMAEREQYRAAMNRARADTSTSDNAASRVYKDRGLSVDTDFRPNYALDQALADVKRRGLLRSVKRVAIVGPGLDFTDKDSGFDYYPLQTLQPFALIDSLVRLEMARATDLKVSIFDISTQSLDHISQAISRARSRQPYTLQLVLDRTPSWNSGALNYWRRLGERIGSNVSPLTAPSQIRNVDRRAVRIPPEIVTTLAPQPLNIVTQHVEAPSSQKFDLIVATNILLYYDRLEQALALLNIESMLNAGGVALFNDPVEDYAGLRLRRVATLPVPYTPDQSDEVRICTLPTFQPQLAPA